MRQIIMNGLTNAVKYSNAPENGAIQVVVRASNDDVGGAQATTTHAAAASAEIGYVTVQPLPPFLCFEVLDCGPGLCGVDEKALFTDFAAPAFSGGSSFGTPPRRASNSHVGSSGVGLPICSRCERAGQRGESDFMD